MRALSLSMIFILLMSCARKGSETAITMGTLLKELSDLRRLAVLPEQSYRTVQFSSYDRRSTKPTDSCWFSNDDGFGNEPIPAFEAVLEPPDSSGTGRYLICDVRQPGAILRLWTAGINGEIRLFLDNDVSPVFEGNAQDFFWKTFEMLSGDDVKNEYQDVFRQFDATYLPIPFSVRCRIEWRGDIKKIHFYHVGIRLYDQDVKVQTFRRSDLKDYEGLIAEAGEKLKNNPQSPPTGIKIDKISTVVIPDSSKKVIISEKGTKSLEYLSLKLGSGDPEAALRKTILDIYFDDSSVPQVQAPLGDFFGTAPGLNPYESLPLEVLPDGSLVCHFVMPFRNSFLAEIENYSGADIKISGSVGFSGYEWQEGRTMQFRARWRNDQGITASNLDAGRNSVQDICYLMASGTGRIAGTAAFIYNPSNATTSWGNWWGEGDEKIFTDRDTFPSFFGTGSEDFFNYSWSSQRLFSYAYCGQTRNDGPGNRGYVSDYRWFISDDIVFRDKISFFMELWHHGVVPGFSYGRIVYYYALPGTVDDYRKISAPETGNLPYMKWDPIAYLGSAGFTYMQAEKIIPAGPHLKLEFSRICADDSLLVWQPAVKGEKLKFFIRSTQDSLNTILGLTLLHYPGGGTFAVTFNGKYLAFNGNDYLNLYEPYQSTLVNHFSEPVTMIKGKNEVILESMDEERRKKIGLDFIWMK